MGGLTEQQKEGPGPDQIFRNALAEGRLILQRCRTSGRVFFYPRVMEPGTGDTGLEWIEASGRGTVYSTTVVRQRPEKGGSYNLAMIDLEEGARVMSRVTGIEPEQVRIGMAVTAYVDKIGDEPALFFRPA